jgi:hypothetical protein
MSRYDLLFWLSLVWLAALYGVVVRAFRRALIRSAGFAEVPGRCERLVTRASSARGAIARGSVPDTWVTVHTGDIGNIFGSPNVDAASFIDVNSVFHTNPQPPACGFRGLRQKLAAQEFTCEQPLSTRPP